MMVANPEIPADQLLGYQTHAEIIRGNNLVRLEGHHLPWDAPEEESGQRRVVPLNDDPLG